jgi:trimethylamine:corrinoid methyltransferase-like protein
LNRDDPDTWRSKGSKSYGDIVRDKARDILVTHEPRPLPPGVQEEIDAIARRAEGVLGELSFEA